MPRLRTRLRSLRQSAVLILTLCAVLAPVPVVAGPVGFVFDVYMRGFRVGEVRFSGNDGPGRYEFQGFMGTKGFFGSFIGTRYSGAVIGNNRNGRLRPSVFRGRFEQRRKFAQVDIGYKGSTPVRVIRTPEIEKKPYDIPLKDARNAVDPITAMYYLLRDRSDKDLCKQTFRVFEGARLSVIRLSPAKSEDPAKRVCNGAYIRISGFSPEQMSQRQAYRFRLTYTVVSEGRYQVDEFLASTTWGTARARRER